jgi:hypothetical protein
MVAERLGAFATDAASHVSEEVQYKARRYSRHFGF